MAKVMRTLGELAEEAKRRTVLFVLVVLTIAYCMSLTSDSVWVNIPIAIVLLAVARRISMELIILWRPSNAHLAAPLYPCKQLSPKDPLISSQPPSNTWRSKIDAPSVEAAIDDLTQRLVAEFVTDLWYSSITPDQEAPQEIRAIINGVIGDISIRAKQVNLINLLTRDIVNAIASHLELYRETKASIGADYFGTLSSDERDEKIKENLASAKKLHPAAISAEMECQVLQRLMGGVLAIVLKPEEAQCKVVRCFAREVLACAVMRPVMNFASPRFINEVIEWLVLSSRRASLSESKSSKSSVVSSEDSSRHAKPLLSKGNSVTGVELAEVGRTEEEVIEDNSKVSMNLSKANPVKADTQIYSGRSGDWALALDAFNQRKTQALAPEHLDNLWAKGRNYKKKDAKKALKISGELEPLSIVEDVSRSEVHEGMAELQDIKISTKGAESSLLLERTKTPVNVDNDYYGRPQDYSSRIVVVGEDSIGVRNAERVIHHPLELPEVDEKTQPRHQRSQSSGGIDQDKCSAMTKKQPSGSSSYYKSKLSCKVIGAHYEKSGSKSFAVYSISVTDSEDQTWVVLRRYRNFEQLHRRLRDMPHYTLSLPPKRFLSSNLDNSFVRERCVLLNKYLKDLLSIPSIAELHEVWDFLSAKSQNYGFGESVSIIKTLAVNVDDAVDDVFRQIRGVSEGVLKTAAGGSKKTSFTDNQYAGSSSMWNNNAPPYLLAESGTNSHSDDEGEDEYGGWHSDSEVHNAQHNLGQNLLEASLSDGHSPVESIAGSDMTEDDTAREWNPPKLTIPLLNLVDIVFELEGRGWIRRQVVWIAKQVLQLGMGDAVDDWMLSKVQFLRREDVIASAIRWLQQVLWPDGIFFLKQRPATNGRISAPQLSFEEQLEAARRAMVVRELIQDRAPTALVSLIGRKQYQRCAKDIYGFLQSQVCMKQLAYSLLEKLIAAAFPELEDLISEVHSTGRQT